MAPLKRYVITRDVPGIGGKSCEELADISRTSNQAIVDVGADKVQWVESYITDDKTYCVYLATDEDMVRKHAELGGFAVTAVEEVKHVLDPTSAST